MIWLVFALLVALFRSLKDVLSKFGLRNINEYILAWTGAALALPFLYILLYFVGIPEIKSGFWLILLIGGLLNTVTTLLYIKALKHSDLSVTVPMLTFTPLFILITSPLILGEFPTIYGLIGILLIVIGAYTLNIKQKKEGYLAPFKALLKEKGPRYMLIVAFIWSITSNLDKLGLQHSSPIFWVVAMYSFVAMAFLPIVLYKARSKFKQIAKHWKFLGGIGAITAASVSFQMMAINLTLVAYVIAIKRTSTIMSSLFGFWLFKEKGIKERLAGVIIMVLGVILIVLA